MGVIVAVVFGKIQSATRRKNAKVIQNVHYPRHELITGRKNLTEISSLKGYVFCPGYRQQQ